MEVLQNFKNLFFDVWNKGISGVNISEIVIALLIITLIGWLSLSFLGKKFFELFNSILKKIPILRTIYSSIGQMTESFTKTDNKQKSVVLLEYPRKGIWAVGFATNDNKGIIRDNVSEDIVNVFLPTTPKSFSKEDAAARVRPCTSSIS